MKYFDSRVAKLHLWVTTASLLFCALPATARLMDSQPHPEVRLEIARSTPLPPGDTDWWQQRASAGDAYAQWVVSARLLQAGPTHYQAALAALKQSAENGYAQAALDWGRVLLHGQLGISKDAPQGLRWIERAEQSGNAEASYVLAEAYWNGWAGTVDRAKGIQWLQRAAEKGWAQARDVLGLMLRAGIEVPQNAHEAARWLERAAVQGRPDAKFAFAEMLSMGQGVEQDDARALNLYRELAKAGYLPAEHKAAAMIAEGRGVASSSAPLRAALEKSAQAGNASAAHELAIGLLNGNYGAPDRVAGLRWLERAAESNHPIAQFYLAEQGQAAGRRVQWLERAARLGYTPAEFGLGMAYAYGDGVPTDDHKAVEWYRLAAEKGHVSAQSSLGWRYLHGVTLPKDEAQALVWMQRAAALGDHLSMRNLISTLLARPDLASHEQALQWIKRLAESGDAQHQGMLGAIYEGALPLFGTRYLDHREALRWFKLAAAQGNAAAQVALGNAYGEGQRVPADIAQAIHWYERAAEAGDLNACLNLARVYLIGRGGTPRNPEKVRFYLARADQSDDAGIRQQAKDLRNPILRWVNPQGQIDLLRLRSAAEGGDDEAQTMLGTAYLQGDFGLPKSLAQAYQWWLKAAVQDNPESMNNVGYTLYRGFLGTTDFIAAKRWFEKAARAGFSNAMVSLARMNERGEGGKPDAKKALDWLLKAGEANNLQAVRWLAVLYRTGGLGEAADPQRAAYWESRTARLGAKATP